ncbi:hypothetical protein DBR25_16560 [Chryseobacterium sp. HMWF001]|nr:hypothetical protein DBR25_16560 [Chryseobacterium sp. HMWF001]
MITVINDTPETKPHSISIKKECIPKLPPDNVKMYKINTLNMKFIKVINTKIWALFSKIFFIAEN